MKVTCISAANIAHARKSSTSYHVCELIKDMVGKARPDWEVDIIALVEYQFTPCIGCGECFAKRECVLNDDFNTVYSRIVDTDALFVVSAHYAPIPAKLCALLEKMEQLAFLPRFHDENAHSPLYQKPVGIIAHGGGTENIMSGYKDVVLVPIRNALSWPIEMNIVGAGSTEPHGVIFPIKEVIKDEDEIFPVQIYDWIDIRRRISPLVQNVLEAAKG